ncbi:MAG: ABC transporter ATP-binding protein/permease, partial [Oscillospiraceae bacterium]|nr:ABC transporter ATP-binding protein/permease [Oscillospiraceae bacterium]
YYMQDYANELRMNNITGKFHEKNRQAKDEAVNITKKTGKPLTALNAANSLIHLFILETAYILYLAYRALVLKVISYGTIISIIRSLWNFSNNMYGFTGALAQLNRHSLYIEKYKEFLAFKSEIKSGDYSLDNEKIEKIELKNISFAYEPGAPVLKNINMTINKGEKVAIVGYNGAGKTTLSNIILRLYEQNSGEILINGKPVEDIEPRSYKRKFSAVFQDFYLYAASLRENIALDINSDEEKTAMAAELSGFKEKLDSFENGLDTNLTKEFEEDGVNLSGGETQKLAIARAVYRESEIIIMDEPSSALDPIAEFNLNQTITQIAKERIVFFISHRLSTTKIADKIFYIENGEITESGTHDELMELNGKYAEMFNIQAEKYNV